MTDDRVFSPDVRGSDRFYFVFSTGRCGTLHLSRLFGDHRAYVCHEEEPEDTFVVMERILRPIAKHDDQVLAMRYVRDDKIPYMVRTMRSKGADRWLDAGHQIIFGIVPALMAQLDKQIGLVRLRRDRTETALSFLTAPEFNDPWMPHWEDTETLGQEHPRWALRPSDRIARMPLSAAVWRQLNRFQRYLWYVDEVERQWQDLVCRYSFPHVEVSLDELNDIDTLDRLSNFMNIGYDKNHIGVRHNATESRPNRHKPNYDDQVLTQWVREYDEIIRVARIVS
jgi:hypothetical protein